MSRAIDQSSEASDHCQPAGRSRSSDDTEAEDWAGGRSCRIESGAESALKQDHEEGYGPDLFEPDHREVTCGRDFKKPCGHPDGQERSWTGKTNALEERYGRECREQ
jgi:hypothetical protein